MTTAFFLRRASLPSVQTGEIFLNLTVHLILHFTKQPIEQSKLCWPSEDLDAPSFAALWENQPTNLSSSFEPSKFPFELEGDDAAHHAIFKAVIKYFFIYIIQIFH